MNPCDSTHPATAPYYREARVTVERRQTACRMRHYCTRRIDECLGRRKLGCTATRLAERQRILEAEASRIAEPMAVSVSNTATQAVAFRRQKAPSSPRLPIKFLSLGGQRGIFSFRGKRISPVIVSLRGRRKFIFCQQQKEFYPPLLSRRRSGGSSHGSSAHSRGTTVFAERR